MNVAVVGLGRIGAVHAQHASEVALDTDGCTLAALVDHDLERAEEVARGLARAPTIFASVDELVASGTANASVVATPTADHGSHVQTLIEAGHRVLLEKPMTEELASDRDLVGRLNRDAPHALMLAFQRRFDPALLRCKEIVGSGALGRPFRAVSILEDSGPPPPGFDTPGLLQDMAIHNVDEVIWLLDGVPYAATSMGSRLHGHRFSAVDEDFDDALLYMWFDDEASAQIQVSRNHVAGYRTDTWIFGELGFVRVSGFDRRALQVTLEARGPDRRIAHEVFRLRDYGRQMPEFVERFGPAYEAELRAFVECCASGRPFPVDQNDALNAMEVVDAASRASIAPHQAGSVEGRR